MKFKKVLILWLLFLTSCEMDVNDRDHALYMINEINYQISNEMVKDKQLHLIGIGGGSMLGIDACSLDFSYYRDKGVEIEEARKDIVEVACKYLKFINQKKELRPFLINFPFDPSNIEIAFFVHDKEGNKVPQGSLILIQAVNGKISYYVAPFEVKSEPILEETFEEALQKVQVVLSKTSGT